MVVNKKIALEVPEQRVYRSNKLLEILPDKQRLLALLYSLFRLAFLTGMVYVLLFPLLVMVSRALRPSSDMYNPSIIWIPSSITLDNFKKAAGILKYRDTLLLTLKVVIISTVFTMASCSMAGYALARFNLKATKLLVALATLTIIVPLQTYVVPLFFQFKFFDLFGIGRLVGLITGSSLTMNLTNTEATYFLTSILGLGIRSGLFILLFTQFFKGMPKELENAARIDGCGECKTFLSIMLPNALPVYLVVFIMSIVWNWNDYFFSSIMLRQKQLLATKIGMLRTLVNMSSTTSSYGDGLTETVVIYAGAILFILPLLIIYMFAQKYFIQSIERTGITG